MNNAQYTMYADFETTVTGDVNQSKTEVWSAAYIYKGELNNPDNVHVLHSLDEFMKYLDSLIYSVKIYFHNLKFDGSFILTYLLQNYKYNHVKSSELKKHEFTYVISADGLWYSITYKNSKNYIIDIWDSLKLAPMSLKALGKSFKTEHQKLEMNYVGVNHYPNCEITSDELSYIKNDVLVLKEVMETLNSENVDAMTIGSACMTEFKKFYQYGAYKKLFPDLTQYKLPDVELGEKRYSHDRTVDDFIRRSYHGGFCYVAPKYKSKLLSYVSHCDANSHYPSMMHSKSGNYYPIGEPQYLDKEGEFNYFKVLPYSQCYYFIRFQCKFNLKKKHIPMVQIKGDKRFKSNEWLSTSNNCIIDLVMTRTDYEQFIDSYNLTDYKFIEVVLFHTKIGLFDTYINHWMKIKQESTGAKRQIAKLFLNNLYGKFAASNCSSYKVASYVPNYGLKYTNIEAHEKKAGYIAIGSAITSYARHYTEMIAQNNYDSFVYADTDSVVMTIPEQEIKGIPLDSTALCCWKVESESDKAMFVRQKTYYEHVIAEDGYSVEPYVNLKCAGMSAQAKEMFLQNYTLEDFKPGLTVTGNLKSKNIDGGILLVDKTYKMR